VDLRERNEGENRHPWELARSNFFCSLAKDLALKHPARVLDVGAGDGWLAEELLPAIGPNSSVVCWDIHYSEDDLAEAGATGAVHRVRELDGGTYDLVLMLDVLEHVEDDVALLESEILPRLNPGAFVIISVPVHPALFTYHDIVLAHVRRYRVREIRALLRRRFDIVVEGSLFTTLLAPRSAQRALELVGVKSRKAGVGGWSGGPAVTQALTRVLDADNRINRRLATSRLRPPGLSYWAVIQVSA
jgi:SAM-dependent methyltransferase